MLKSLWAGQPSTAVLPGSPNFNRNAVKIWAAQQNGCTWLPTNILTSNVAFRGVSSTRLLLDTRVLVDLLLVWYSNLHVERVVADNRYSTLTTRVDRRVMKSQFLAIFRQIFKIFGYFPPNFRIFDYVLPKYRNF